MKKSKTAYKLLAYLSDGKFHSGQSLGRALGITRSAIWKAIQQLNLCGVEIQSISGKGYRIPRGMELLEQSIISQHLNQIAKSVLNDLIILDQVTSTNDYLLSLIPSHRQHNIACFAEYQTHARGRRGKTWITPFGTNIYHSLLWHFNKDPAEIVGLSLAIGVAVYNALKQYGIKGGITLKWPNDILYYDKKLAGILLETTAEHHEYCSVVIGVGINTYIPSQLGHQINQPWIDIYELTQSNPNRNRLAGLLLNNIVQSLQLFEDKGLPPFLATWRKLDNMIGKKIILHTSDTNIEGVMRNVSDKGELILLNDNGQEKKFLSGEVSLRLAEV